MRTFSPQQISDAFDNAPKSVREVFSSPSAAQFLASIADTYKLHLDVADNIGKMVTYMLLGLMSPPELLQEMKAEGIAEDRARQIMNDINERIFKPIQQKMRGDSPQSAGAAPAQAARGPQVSAPSYQPPAPRVPIVPSRPMPLPQVRPMPTPPPAPRVVPPPANLPGALPGDRLLPNHEEPHMEIPLNIPPIPQKPSSPPPSFQNPMPKPPSTPPPPSIDQYKLDPYREPLE